MKPFEVGGVLYSRSELMWLREELIKLRDQALDKSDMTGSVLLTHTIGVLSTVAKELES